MADPSQACGSLYTSLCSLAKNGISVMQPTCQVLPGGGVAQNPVFLEPPTAKTFFTYKFFSDVSDQTKPITCIVIPVCASLTTSDIVVSEGIDGWGDFTLVPFSLSPADATLGDAPSGYQFLKLETAGRFGKGVSVLCRLEIAGETPTALQPLMVKTGNIYGLVFDCPDCFLVPGCAKDGKLQLTQECFTSLNSNRVSIQHEILVQNRGSAALTDVHFRETVALPPGLTAGTAISPSLAGLTATGGPEGQIIVDGELGSLNPGQQVPITYGIPINGIPAPGEYVLNGTTEVWNDASTATAVSGPVIGAVGLSVDNCSRIDNLNLGVFSLKISSAENSPPCTATFFAQINLPFGVTVQFTDFDGCTAAFAKNTSTVPLNTNVTGPMTINLACSSVKVPAQGTAQKNITLLVVSTLIFGSLTITNTLREVSLTEPSRHVFLGAGPLPVSSSINVTAGVSSHRP